MSRPRYARFYKADLQMHTPGCIHWRGARLPVKPTQDQYVAAADAYIARCYDVGLELIGITDHNLGPDCGAFISHLGEAIQRAAKARKYKIALFPGFEVAAPIGKGAHLLCLFEPGTPVSVLSDKLS